MTASKTTVDWFRFRTQAEVREGLEALRPLFGDAGQGLHLHHLDRGKDGFQQASAVLLGDMVLGRVDFGGASQRGWVRWNLSGKGCEWVKEWDAVDSVESLPQAELRRVDLALTTWRGEVTHERVVEAHARGGFCAGGRPPLMQEITHSDPRAGRTVGIGKRGSDKYCRGYEKGFEMAGRLGAWGRELDAIEGAKLADIYRVEVELHSDSRPVAWEVIGRRDQYFAGSYPFLAELLPGVECDILMRRPERAPQAELMAAVTNARVQYGNTLFTLLRCVDGDIGKAWSMVCGDQHNPALLAAGVMLVEHDL